MRNSVQKFLTPCNYNYKKYNLIGPETTLFKINQSRATRKWCDLTTGSRNFDLFKTHSCKLIPY